MPASNPPSFAADIRPLFRESDIAMMMDWFDLSNRDHVAENAGLILERIEDGSMPCDGGWEEAQIALFRAWKDAGCPA